ncbi:MAG: hypothetical protein AABM64_01160 [Pseudomonadota bacterium]
MSTNPIDDDSEIAAISAINAALAKVTDSEARLRVLNYIWSRYRPQLLAGTAAFTLSDSSLPLPLSSSLSSGVSSSSTPLPLIAATARELNGIARITDNGELRITARDLKAKSGLDAALRLAHIAIYAHERLTGQPLSSRKGLTPLLREWRLYTGNVRAKLARERGIIRSSDSLLLDAHARRDAERYIEEILSDEVAGQWRPK